MKRNIISLVLTLSFFIVNSYGQLPSITYDSMQREWRPYDAEKIDEYKSDPDFDYGNRPVPAQSLWDRFLAWLNTIIGRAIYMGTTTPIGKILIYVLIGAIIIYALLKLFKVDIRKAFFSTSDSGVLAHEIHHENIHQMDFEHLIKEAINKNEFKQAIRLIYLFALKHLADQHMIQWQPGKTNHDYLEELKEEKIKNGFSSLSFYFEYAWYGDFTISKDLFSDIHVLFESWKKELPE